MLTILDASITLYVCVSLSVFFVCARGREGREGGIGRGKERGQAELGENEHL